MADEGPLSQADIDALTSGLLGGSGGGFDPDALRQEVEVIIEQGSSVIGTLISRGSNLVLGDIRAADPGMLSEFGDEGLCLHVGLEGGINGELAFLLGKSTAALLAGLMMGGDGAAAFKDEDLDALNELGNQLMGSVCTALGAKHGISVSATQVVTSPLDPSNPPFSLDGAAFVEAELAIDGADPAPLRILLTQALVEAFSEVSNGSGGSGGSGGLLASQGGYDGTMSRGMSEEPTNIQMLLDINLNVTIELGRTRLSIRKILELGPGSIIELDRLAGEPVDLLVNDKVVAKGEVVVVDEYFGIRIISLVSPEERIKQLR